MPISSRRSRLPCRESSDAERRVTKDAMRAEERALTLLHRASQAEQQGQLREAERYLNQAQKAAPSHLRAKTSWNSSILYALARLRFQAEDIPNARRFAVGALDGFAGRNDTTEADVLRLLGTVEWLDGDPQAARAHLDESTKIYRRPLDDPSPLRLLGLADALRKLGILARDAGALSEARSALMECLDLYATLEDQYIESESLSELVDMAAAAYAGLDESDGPPPRAPHSETTRIVSEMEPQEVLGYIAAQRSRVWSLSHRERLKLFAGSMPPLVNPLLVATAAAISSVRPEDYQELLATVNESRPAPHMEAMLLTLPPCRSEEELQGILQIESKYIQALVSLGTDLVVRTGGPLIPERTTATMWDVFWGAWLVLNPIEPPKAEQLWRLAVGYGFATNDAVHRAREEAEFRLNDANRQLNEALRGSLPKHEMGMSIASAVVRQKNASLLVERAWRLYYWSPHEISAHATETVIALELAEVGHPVGERYHRWLLPPEIQDQLRNRKDYGGGD